MNSTEAVKAALEKYKKLKLVSNINPSRLIISWNTYELLQNASEEEKRGLLTIRTFCDIPLCVDPNIVDDFFYFSME